MSESKFKIGTLLLDNGVLGIIINEIRSGTWSEQPLFNWTTSYEIKYFKGDRCIMTEKSLERLIKNGRIEIIGENLDE